MIRADAGCALVVVCLPIVLSRAPSPAPSRGSGRTWTTSPALFLVWAQGRQSDGIANDFSFRRDLRNVFDTHPNNTFLVKLSYWFNP